jgi:excisionase family DNA binding protein
MAEIVWVDAAGAADYVVVSKQTILRAARCGALRGFRISGRKCWRFRLDDVDAWMMRSSTPVLVDVGRESRRLGHRANLPPAGDARTAARERATS